MGSLCSYKSERSYEHLRMPSGRRSMAQDERSVNAQTRLTTTAHADGHRNTRRRRKVGSYDQEIEIRAIPALFAQSEREDKEAAQSRHLRHTRSGGKARARGTVLQAQGLTTLRAQWRAQGRAQAVGA